MTSVKDIAFTVYPTTDRQRARDFFEGVLHLQPSPIVELPDGYWIEYNIGASTLAICSYWKPSAQPSMGPCIALEVENYETTLADLRTKNVPVLETHESPVCFMAMVSDPDGNSLWIHQRKPGRP